MSELDLKQSFLNAMENASNRPLMRATTTPPLAMDIWGYSIPTILKMVIDKARELGREYRPQIEDASKAAVDDLVALDLPWIPDSIEGVIDDATRSLGYAAIKYTLDAILAE